MSSTSTNKQPLLVDRPLHEFVVLGPTPALSDSANFGVILSGGCVPLVDCSSNDGAVVDSLSITANQANTTAVKVLFFLSKAATVFAINDTNTVQVASATLASTTAGERTNVSLPPLCIPVPHLGADSSISETDKKNSGLYVPAGMVLYAGLNEIISLPSPATKINVFAQGGYF